MGIMKFSCQKKSRKSQANSLLLKRFRPFRHGATIVATIVRWIPQILSTRGVGNGKQISKFVQW